MTDIMRRIVGVTDQFDVGPLEGILLAEFTPGPDIRVMSEFFDADAPRAAALGKRLHRVINQAGQVVSQYDEKAKICPLTFMEGAGRLTFASARPGDPYAWQLVGAEETAGDALVFMVRGVRMADEAESAHLDAAFPGWLDLCLAYDARAEQERAEELERGKLGVPRPKISVLEAEPLDVHFEDQDEAPVGEPGEGGSAAGVGEE